MSDDKTRLELPVEIAERIRGELVELHNASPSVLLLTDQEISAAFYAAAEGLQEMEREILKNEIQKFMIERTRVMAAAIREKLQELGEASFKEKAAVASEEIAQEITRELEKEIGQLDKEGIKARLLSELRNSLRPNSAPVLAASLGPAEVNIQNIGIAERIMSLHDKLSARAREFGVECPKLSLPPVITDITPAHLEAMDAVFGKGNLEPLVLPDINDLNDDYFNMMYPPSQRPKDTARGLIAWRNRGVNDVHFASLKTDARNLKDALIFIETIRKPQRADLGGFYGSIDGRDTTKDAIYKMIIKNRFGLSWLQINHEIALAVARRLEGEFRSRNLLATPVYAIMIQPALAANLSTVLNHPENSQGLGFEWSSTPLLGESEQFLTVCGSFLGAGRLGSDTKNATRPEMAFRLAVVFRK